MSKILIIIILLLVAAAQSVGTVFFLKRRLSGHSRKSEINRGKKTIEIEKKERIVEELKNLQRDLIPFVSLADRVHDLRLSREQLRAEQGRSSITKAELETLETRLRELDEIERELEASTLETEEEKKIVSKKEADFRKKNDELKDKMMLACNQFEATLDEIGATPEQKEQFARMKEEISATQEKVDRLVANIDEGNQEYFVLKQRYDALDIEYAQLYEKFSQEEQAGGS